MTDTNGHFDLQDYLARGVERVVSDAVKATLKDPRESIFMARFAAASRAASKKRRLAEDAGEHIPPFLIASITSTCNLHCAGCYSRCNHATVDEKPVSQLTSAEWLRIFDEADVLRPGEAFSISIPTAVQSRAPSRRILMSIYGIRA